MAIRRWTKDDLKLAFYLYCQIPFGRLHHRNPKIIQLASVIDRTPSAVAMKLVNFASIDPDIRESGRRGLGNASDLDREIWNDFHTDWERLSSECEKILRGRGISAPALPGVTAPENERNYEGRTRPAVVQARIGQRFFRSAVITSYDVRCCMTGLSVPELLVASHIVPWSADPKNRLNPHNGLCLSALHDRAFDAGLITVTEKYVIKVSNRLLKGKENWLNTRGLCNLAGKRIQLPSRFYPDPEFLKYHSTMVFKH